MSDSSLPGRGEWTPPWNTRPKTLVEMLQGYRDMIAWLLEGEKELRTQLQAALSERDEARTNEIAWSECIVMAQETLDALIFVKRLDRGQAAMFLPEAIRNACILSRDEALAHQEEEHRIALASARAEERQLLGMLKGCEQMLGEARAEGERLRTENAKLWNCLSLTRDDVFIGWADPELIDPTLGQMTTPEDIG